LRGEESILNAGVKLYQYLMKQDYVDEKQIYVMGYSYGTGIAAYVASKCPCQKLVLVAPYRNSADMYNRYTPIYYGPMTLWLTENFKTEDYAKNISAETLLITSDGDQTLSKKFAYDLQEVFQKAQVKEYKEVTHDSYFKQSKILVEIQNFFK